MHTLDCQPPKNRTRLSLACIHATSFQKLSIKILQDFFRRSVFLVICDSEHKTLKSFKMFDAYPGVNTIVNVILQPSQPPLQPVFYNILTLKENCGVKRNIFSQFQEARILNHRNKSIPA